MEQSKYYYPLSIEELSVGMEIELYGRKAVISETIQNDDGRYVDKYTYSREWYKTIFNPNEIQDRELSQGYIETSIENKWIRIPYLIIQDIIDEGFVFVEKTIGTSGKTLRYVNSQCDLYYYEQDKSIIIQDDYGDSLFKGIANNKTDFKRLLKQLNIK